MALTDYKVRSEDFNNKDIMGLPDKPSEAGINAATLKERFDAGSKKVLGPKFNQLIEALLSTEGAANIGAAQIEGVSGYTVQEILAAMKVILDTKQSIEQSNIDIGKKFDKTEAQSLVKDISFTENTGVFKITKYDGTEISIDTALEKVALDVRLEGQQFVLTLADGTEQRVDLSAFLTQTEIKDSDTISLSEEDGVIVARIKASSVKKEHLAPDVTEYIEEKEQAAASSAEAALTQAGNAKASADAAATSQEEARDCANQACVCASNAEVTEREIEALKSQTEEKANAAKSSADAAATSVSAAAAEADRAKKEADRASDIVGGDFLERSIYDPQGRREDIFDCDIDCGYFVESEAEKVVANNASKVAHRNIIIDGNQTEVHEEQDTLAEHEVNPNAHQNMTIDGND